MRTRAILSIVVLSVCVTPAAWGQQALSDAQIRQILQQLTSQPRNTWLPAGTIQAYHWEEGTPKTTDEAILRDRIAQARQDYVNNPRKLEQTEDLRQNALDAIEFNVRYRLANHYEMTSEVTVYYDHGLFYWEIRADPRSRQDSVRAADYGVTRNPMARYFNMNWNQRRIFAWDGQEYTTYSASAGSATVDAAGKLPRAVTGPLTAGLIPWGYGPFSRASLASAEVSATETDGAIDMTLTLAGDLTARLILDPDRAYAVTKALLTTTAGSSTIFTCSDYRQFGGYWVPWEIAIDRESQSEQSYLPTSEQWQFKSVSAATPAVSSFNVSMPAGTVVQAFSPLSSSPAIYVKSSTADTAELLAERLAYASEKGIRPQNCATAAIRRVASVFGKSIRDSALAGLEGADGRTSLYALKRVAQDQGLFCRAVRTDLAGLRSLHGVQAILHLPGRSHFVVFNAADDREVWITDLSSRKFFYRRSADLFARDWSGGTALLLSDRPLPASPAEISDAVLATIVGAEEGYECNTLLQINEVFFCTDDAERCTDAVIIFYERWGCGPASSGWCEDDQLLLSCAMSPCAPINYWDCTITGEWYYYYFVCCG